MLNDINRFGGSSKRSSVTVVMYLRIT